MPVFSRQQLNTIPALVDARLDIVRSWFYSQSELAAAEDNKSKLLAGVYREIKEFLTPIYDPDPDSVHQCVGSVKYLLKSALNKHDAQAPFFRNEGFRAHLINGLNLDHLDELYTLLKAMTEANPAFEEIEQMHLTEEKTPIFNGYKFDYIGPEDREAEELAVALQI